MFSRFASVVSRWTGSPYALAIVAAFTAVWAYTAGGFGFNEIATVAPAWLLVLLQADLNRDSLAAKVQRDEIIAATPGASNALIGLDRKTAAEIEAVRG